MYTDVSEKPPTNYQSTWAEAFLRFRKTFRQRKHSLMIEASCSSKTLVYTYQTIRRHISLDNLRGFRSENSRVQHMLDDILGCHVGVKKLMSCGIRNISTKLVCAGIAQSVWRLTTIWKVRGWNPGGGKVFRNHTDRNRGHPVCYAMGTGSLSRGQSGRGVVLTTHPPPT